MPEGDTIFRTAVRLREVLLGQEIQAASARESTWPPAITGSRVRDVESRGKHLLIHLDRPLTIHSHMGMTGSWHVYRPGETWRKPARRAAMVLNTPAAVAVCFSPKTLELLSELRLKRHPYLSRLGPDLLAAEWDPIDALRRFRPHAGTPLGEAVMNQTIVCGIGNVYKSEVLFLEQLNPFLPIGELPDADLLRVMQRARKLMGDNLEGYPRRTRHALDGRRLWVYGRNDQPCFRCGTLIHMRRQGDLGRSTYWCPDCQPAR